MKPIPNLTTKGIATAKVQVELPQFTGDNLDKWAEEFYSFFRLTGQRNAPVPILSDHMDKCCKKVSLKEQVKQTFNRSSTFREVLGCPETMFSKFQSRLRDKHTTSRVNELLGKIDCHVGCLTPGSYDADELLPWLVRRIPKTLPSECRGTEKQRAHIHTYAAL